MTEDTKTKTYAEYVLPPTVVTRVDIARLVREVEWVDNELTTAMVRAKAGVQQPAQPVITGALEDFLRLNKLSLEAAQKRSNVLKQLRQLKDSAPIIHMTFAVNADRESLQELAAWLRSSIHPQAVISVGLQPALVAGVYLRTPNHVHDFSMRAALGKNRSVLVKELESLRG